ncbi:nuclear transport factor 2 family protein [Sneathiella sp. HT1-7]|uniref:nuclear transport factor 2 family protein n=1 Tax=Sneathiella sp. HT1-7 TaxID=2887192 RepID=UPI001D151530|nr:nuclear transport factor 2 family protein [Sneathiella sp. HT1-7]MCC3303337.1 nuclear transport factor 2 family protein [Sneathiella sp. HT1-7]
MIENTVAAWHDCIKESDPQKLDALLHEDATFHSPVVHTPQHGKSITGKYLMAAFQVLNGDDFEYVREIVGPKDAVLEFTTTIDGIVINGVDLIQWGDDGRIVDFKVMIRPLKAINLVHQKMAEMLVRSA